MNNVGFHMKGKTKRLNSVMVCMRFKTHRYIAGPISVNLFDETIKNALGSNSLYLI
jgi:hypothetical protein